MRITERRENEQSRVRSAVRWVVPAGLAAAVTLIPLLSLGDQTVMPGILPPLRARTARSGTETSPLVHVDEELGTYLTQAMELIEKEKFDQAIQILQALIMREESGFFAQGDNRFVSMRLKANELIGSMGPKGLKLYRVLYDPQAHQLYEEAIASASPERLLRKLSERYLHTTYGPQALEMLGALYFDRARFSQAALCWRQLLPLAAEGSPRATLLAKVLAAHHLAGEASLAAQAADELGKKYADMTVVLGGQDRKLGQFAAQVRTWPAAAVEAAVQEQKEWPGLGGVPTGLATMSDCDIVLAPRWPQDGQGVSSTENLAGKLKVGGSMLTPTNQYGPNHFIGNQPNPNQRAVYLRNGQLFLKGVNPSAPDGEVLPGLLHPVVAGDLVIVRLDDRLVAFDLLTGVSQWGSLDLPMVRKLAPNPNMNMYYGGNLQYIGDTGRYGLTVGGDMVFTVYDYLPTSSNLGWIRAQSPNAKDLDDTSMLAAVSLKGQGLLLWRRGRGQGDQDVLRGGTYLCPPTYRAGRLYAMVLYLERYYVVCLDAATGTTIWQAPIAQAPAIVNRYGMPMGLDPRLGVGSPPAVADGRVYVTTNSGVVAAFEEETGQPLWGYQYPSKVNVANSQMNFGQPMQYQVYRPGNPLIVSRRRVVCLPADAESLLALDADTGEVKWSRTRRNQNDLSAIDGDRVLISGKGLFVMRISDGEQLNQGQENMGVYGRPAVTSHQVLASALGKVEIMDLKTYATSNKDLSSPDAVLGNLISVDGKLISASMMGPYAYFSYDVAREELTKRMDRSPKDKQPGMLRQRARLSMDARKFDKALEDIQAAEKLAKELNDAPTLAALGEMYYSTYVGLGNHATSDKGMKEMFDHAVEHASSKQEQGHMKFRLALYEERVGHYERAAEMAQELADNFGQEELVEVEIGPNAPDRVRFGVKDATVPGEKMAKDYIKGLIEKYGRTCYAKFDALAKEALTKAEAEGDPQKILAVEKTWPNSEWADDSLFRAAEAYYLSALDFNDKAAGTADKAAAAECAAKADDHLAEARRLLYRVSHLPDSPFRVSASMALATIYARGGWVTLARRECGTLVEVDGQTEVAFANVKGKLADVLKTIEGSLAGPVRFMKVISRIDTPLAEIFSLKGESVTILRDQEYRPVRIGEKIAVIKDSDVFLMETTSGTEADALAGWKGLASLDKNDMIQFAYSPPGMRLVGGLSKDQKTLVVADRKSIRGLDVVSAKVSWETRMENIGIRAFYCMAVGDGVLMVVDQAGKLVCVDMADGKVKGQNDLVGQNRMPIGPPQIAGQIAVLRYNGGRSVACFDLSKECRLVGKWTANQWTNTEITDDGLLVMLLDDELSVREPSNINKPLWTAKYDVNRDPSILAVSSEMVAISPSNTTGTIEVFSVSGGGKKLATLETAPTGNQAAIPLDAQFDGDNLYILAGPGMGGRRKANFGRQSASRGMNLQKFSIPDGKRRWECELENIAMFYPNILPIVVGQKSVAVTARHFQIGMPFHTYVVDSETGKIAQKFDMRGQAAGVKDDGRRRQSLGQAVMTDGRLCVENVEGVTVYGKQ
jgi:outer membrane protein assembly factor BamB